MTKFDIVKGVAKKAEANQNEVAILFDMIIDEIKEAMVSGNEVTIRGFGAFKPKLRKAKTARNITTGELVDIPAHYEPFVKFSRELREEVGKLEVK